VRRTQIYLDERQSALLDARAVQEGRTRSDLIRAAVDAFLESDDEQARLQRFREAVFAAAGAAPDFDLDGLEAMKEAGRQRLDAIARALSE
jgi:Arc/MetJ-type ribon-helix-helix transcriptional regulator